MAALEEQLLEAVDEKNVELIISLLQQGADVNSSVQSGLTILGRAVQIGQILPIEALLNTEKYVRQGTFNKRQTEKTSSQLSKCNVNLKDNYDRTPLHYAAEHGKPEILKLLLKAGCRVDVSDGENVTPLHLAACRGHEEFIEILLNAGCEVNRKTRYTSDKSSALHIAASRGFPAIVEKLIKHGAKIDALDSSDRTPLLLAVSRANHEVVRILLSYGAKVNTEEIHGYTPLAEAVWKKDEELVRMLLEAGAKVTKSHHLLHYCVLYRNQRLVELLLRSGCLVNVRDDNGDTPLHVALRVGESVIINALLQHGANVNYPNGLTGTSPLHEAVEGIQDSNHQTFSCILRRMIDCKCKLDQESFTPGDTPLYRAILLDKFLLAASLIRHGADVNRGHVYSCNIDNLCLAHRKGSFFVVKLLVFAGFNLSHTPWLEILPSELQHSYSLSNVKGWLIHMKTNPLSLADSCRKSFRRHLGQDVYAVISTMSIPERIKRFLLLEDVDY